VLASGASALRIEHEVVLAVDLNVTHYRLALVFDGEGFTRAELQSLYDYAFVSQADRSRDRLRELALGIMSCQALKPTAVRIHSRDASWVSDSEHKEKVLDRTPEALHRIEVQGPGKGTEVELVRNHCMLVPVPIFINQEQVSGTVKHQSGVCPWPSWRFERGELRGWIGLPYAEMSRSSLSVLRYGVQFARRLEHRLNPPVSIVFEDPRLRKNASQTDVVEDEGYFACLQDLQQVLFDFSLEFRKKHIPGYQRQAVQTFLLQLFADWLSPEVLLSSQEETSPELDRLLSVPLFTDRKGRMWPLKELVTQYRRDGFLSLCTKRYPYAPLGDWLVLNPGEGELALLRSLFDRVRWVDEEIHRISAGAAVRRTEAIVVPPSSATALAERQVVVGSDTFVLRVPNEYPSGNVEVFVARGDGWVRHVEWVNGWALQVEVQSEHPEDAVRHSMFAVRDGAEALYEHLLKRLLKSNRTPQHRQPILRATEHLVAFWSSRFHVGWPGVRGFAERVVSARETLGTAVWEAPLFATRSGSLVSLKDMAAWLGSFESLTVAYGGRVFEGDHALDASPSVARFLATLFGSERIRRVTLGEALLQERQQQALLSGAAEHPEKLVAAPPEPEAPEDWEEISLEAVRAALEAEKQATEAAEPPLVEAPPVAPEPVELAEPEPAHVEPSGEIPPDEEEQEAVEPPVFSPAPEPVLETTRGLEFLRQHTLSQEGLAGWLALPLSGSGSVSICQNGHERAVISLFDLPLVGWLVVADNRDLGVGEDGASVVWTEEQAEILLGHLASLYDELARGMDSLDPNSREFRRGRQLLVDYLGRLPERARRRLEEARPDDPVIHLRFLPAAGGTLADLRSFWDEARSRGSLHVLQEFGLNPDLAYTVAVVGRTVTEEFYQSVLGVSTVHPFRQPDQPIEERFLNVLRRELRLLREQGDFRLSDDILAGIDWHVNAAHFVDHNPTTRVTGLNPDHRVVKGVLKRFDQDRRLLPVLVSSVYTAINRALAEIRDEDELAFLAALLEAYPDEQSRVRRDSRRASR
ncbi:MAG: hypothetical protein AB1758_15075, partial [Candidatus Eremiobacterota bacterium]